MLFEYMHKDRESDLEKDRESDLEKESHLDFQTREKPRDKVQHLVVSNEPVRR